MSTELTKAQQNVLTFVDGFIRQNGGMSPTFADVADAFGMSKSGAYQHCVALREKGRLTWRENQPRTMRLADDKNK